MYQMRNRIRLAAAVVAAMGLGFVVPGTASAEPSTPTIETLFTGLNGPRKVTWDARLHVALVAEAGQTQAACIPPGTPTDCFSKSGSVFAWVPFLNRGERVLTGLPALVNPGGLSGVNKVQLQRNGELLSLFGLTGRTATRDAHGPDAAALGQVNRIAFNGRITPVADLVAFEDANNPDAGGFNSNPFGLFSDSRGTVVTDAGANAVLSVGRDGQLSVLDVPPRIPFAGRTIDPVPTSIVRGPDGAYYYGELEGGPFPKGLAPIWRIVPGQERTLVATGFTNIIDIAFDCKGRLLVLEYAENGLASGNPAGRLVRIEKDGTQTVLARDGLVHPGGLAVAPNGDIYVTNNISGPDGSGQLLRIRGAG